VTNILAIDTSTPACSAAILRGDEVLSRHQLASREHTRLILPMVDDLFNEAGITLADMDAIAFTVGPGSFTGIRIGFGVAQGLAFGAELPVLPVSSLETLAHTAIRKLQIQDNTHIIPMFDARMDEIYAAHFYYSSGSLQRLHKDSVCSPEKIDTNFYDPTTSDSMIIVGDGWNYSERIPIRAPSYTDIAFLPEAQDIFNIALPLIDQGKAIPIEEASPVYLRDQITWKKRKKLR
jgi:tRNA threonylcarbamoyladenosine biosynthesis protein TsaB